ncbi:WXG100 family type VII secretion target [Allostreptomyces psammosilenae]|uniref:Uncharacterized protein YukE n=1 Tax=Allostreptomyces psammosilenae TaxID=1892865 RepID=A0A853A218_9ACTN|nr:WXG100 family type VII secretion target [Allostreptomyces psammosilenae]NYI08177.1 uncharacterized protein YukE [Allostreptomyces psammosilenae]
MAVMLPEELEYPLRVIGITWPDLDEDAVREVAQAFRDYADEIASAREEADGAVAQLLAGSSGEGMEAFGGHWEKVSGQHFQGLADASRTIASALDTAATAIEAGKCSIVAQLDVLAPEIAAAVAAAAPATPGLPSLAGLGPAQTARTAVREILRETAERAAEALTAAAGDAVLASLEGVLTELLGRGLENATGLRDGYDAGRAGDAGHQGGADPAGASAAAATSLAGADGAAAGSLAGADGAASLAGADRVSTSGSIAEVMRGTVGPAAEVPPPTGNPIIDAMRGHDLAAVRA